MHTPLSYAPQTPTDAAFSRKEELTIANISVERVQQIRSADIAAPFGAQYKVHVAVFDSKVQELAKLLGGEKFSPDTQLAHLVQEAKNGSTIGSDFFKSISDLLSTYRELYAAEDRRHFNGGKWPNY